MNEQKLHQKLAEVGVTCDHTSDSLEYKINTDNISSMTSEEQKDIFNKIVSGIGLDIYNQDKKKSRYNKENNTAEKLGISVDIHARYLRDLTYAAEKWSDKKTLTIARKEKDSYKVNVAALSIGGVVFTGGLTFTLGAYLGEKIFNNELYGELGLGTLIGAPIALGLYKLIKGSVRTVNNYKSRKGAQKMYNALNY